MAKNKSDQRERARLIYLRSAGKKSLSKIAEELCVPLSTVKTWKCRDSWAASLEEILSRTPAKRRYSFPKGNKAAVGSPGNRTNNKNHLVTGEFEKIFFDTLTEEELQLVAASPQDECAKLIYEYKINIVRERRILKRIEEARGTTEDNASDVPGRSDKLTRLENALNNVQSNTVYIVDRLHKFGFDDSRLQIDRDRFMLEKSKSDTELQYLEGSGDQIQIIYDYGGE